MSDSWYLAGDCEKSRSSNGREIKVLPKSRQVLFSGLQKPTPQTSFSERLRIAFKGARNTEIAQKLAISNSTVTEYMKGESYPAFERLVQISEVTKCNLHWLLTGEGDADRDPLQFLTEPHRKLLTKLAEDRGLSIEGVLLDLVTQGLLKLGSDLFAQYESLHTTQLEQLQALYEAFYGTRDDEATSSASTSQRQAS